MFSRSRISMAMINNHNERSDTIADYCNDRLSPKDRVEFERLLREDKDVAQEYSDFRGFQKAYRQLDSNEPAPSNALFDRITQAVHLNSTARERRGAQRAGLLRDLTAFWQQLRASVAVPWMFAAAQAVVIVLLLVPLPRQTSYSTLSSAEVAVGAADRGVNVVFHTTATEGEIRSLLHALGGSVSSGPSQEGRYVISFTAQGDLEVIMKKMRQSPIVAFAEPVR
jgi:anti-sigma-K factor RskA